MNRQDLMNTARMLVELESDQVADPDEFMGGLLQAFVIACVVVADVLVEECKAGGAIDQLRYRKGAQ